MFTSKAIYARVSFATLLTFLPTTVLSAGCSDTYDEQDKTAPSAPESQAGAASLEVKSANGNTRNVDIPRDGVEAVLANKDKFVADGVETDDLAAVLTAKRIEIGVGGKSVHIVREGDSLTLEGGTSGAKVDVNGTLFTVASAAGSWDCTLRGMSEEAARKLAGAMALGVLLMAEESLAAEVEQGNCEVGCVAVVAIIIIGVIGVGLITAYITCKIVGPDICARAAARSCGAGNVRRANMDCESIFDFSLKKQDGKTKASGKCNFDCK